MTFSLFPPTTKETQSNTAQVLRPYQVDAITAVMTAWSQGKTPLVSAATGLGKTTILSELLRLVLSPATQRAIVIAHTEEIIYQLFERIQQQFGASLQDYYGPTFQPGIGIVMANQDASNARIVVGTRQSLHPARLAEIMKHGQIDYLIIDESHHVSADNTYWQIAKTLKDANPTLRVAGFTATPKRGDGKALGVLFDTIAYEATIQDGIRWGYLVSPTRLIQKTNIDISGIKSEQGDYSKAQLVEVLTADNWIDLAVKAYQEKILPTGRLTLAFFPQVEMSILFTRKLQELGIAAAHIDGKTDKQTRRGILRDYKSGKVRIISNYAVLTEGFDAPETGAILWARPTRSAIVLTQAIGRGLRPFPGKTDCLMVDLTVADTKALQVGTLLGKTVTCRNPKCQAEFYKGFKNCPVCGYTTKATADSEEELELELDPLAPKGPRLFEDMHTRGEGTDLIDEIGSLFDSLYTAWYTDTIKKDGWYSTSAGINNGSLVIMPPTYSDKADRIRERQQAGLAMVASVPDDKRAQLARNMDSLMRELIRIENYTLYYVPEETNANGYKYPGTPKLLKYNSDLTGLMADAEREAVKLANESKSKKAIDKNAAWRYSPATPGQLNYLKRLGVTYEEGVSKGQAAQMITHTLATKEVARFITLDILPEPKKAQE